MNAPPTLTVLSLGGGMQYSVMALMAGAGVFDRVPDCAIFADTHWEPPSAYEHIQRLADSFGETTPAIKQRFRKPRMQTDPVRYVMRVSALQCIISWGNSTLVACNGRTMEHWRAKAYGQMITPQQQAEMQAQRSECHKTMRVSVPALEESLYTPIPLLDHGFVRVVDYMGDDSAIVQAARVSYGRGTRRVSDDRGLIRYLMRHRHTTPFEMCEIKLHVKLPIFVARQWIRHRTANVNEYSARYSILDREFYVPSTEVIAAQSLSNRQGRGDLLPERDAARVQDILREDALRAHDHYEELLNEMPDGGQRDPGRVGLARELARINLSLNFYTQWYWKVDLHNLLNFISLRADPHAQYEIRVYAEAILNRIVKLWVPLAYGAFCDYRLNGQMLSAKELSVVRELVSGHREKAQALRKGSGIPAREWRELMDTLGLEP